MKEKIKILTKIVIFIVIFALLFFVVQWCFINHSDQSYKNIHNFYDQKENSLDAVYIGSSNCFTYWNPAFAWDEYGIAVYSYSANYLLFEGAEYIIRDCIEKQPDAKFIVNINTLIGDRLKMQEIHHTTSNMPLSINRFNLVKHLCDMGNVSFIERMEYYFPMIRFHNDYTALMPGHLLDRRTEFKGSSTYEAYLKLVSDISSEYGDSGEMGVLSEKLKKSTESLLDYCDEKNIDVLFVTVPQGKNETEAGLFNAINKLISDRGYKTLNLMEKTDEMNIDKTCDFYNKRHTNIHGSIKFTHYVGGYLVDTFGFEDKRGREDYSDWDAMTEQYLKTVSPYILDMERDMNKRDFSLVSPQKLSLEDGVLSWEEVEGADYYYVYKKDGKTKPWERVSPALEENIFTDEEFAEGSIYTVVPVVFKDSGEYFGNFPYLGISAEKKDAENVKENVKSED